ncbi:MAG: phosphotransferase [Rhizobiales bacterium]|nr:phosphotransferase [Hyphomicrobiales bacterium]
MDEPSHIARLEAVFEQPVSGCQTLGRTWGLQVLKVEFPEGPPVLAKAGVPDLPGHLEIEAFMLRELMVQSDLPVPGVLHCEADLLAIEWIDNDGPPKSRAHEHHAAELLAELHSHSSPIFGYGRNTVIGGLFQPNGESESWVEFFTHKRLLYMARIALGEGALAAGEFSRLETLAGRLERYLEEPDKPSLLHGDLWQGNILVKGEQIAGMIDPAVYFGHREIELAFTTLFGTFGDAFFDAYGALCPLDQEFFTLRKDLYNLYPNLVHAALFGRSYVPPILRVLDRLGI